MPVATANGKKFTFPDGTTPEQMGQAIDEYFAKSESMQINATGQQLQSDVPLPPDEIGMLNPEQQKQYFGTVDRPDRTIGERVGGAIEAAGSMASGMTTGLVGGVAGGLYGIGKSVVEGTYGTPEAAQESARTGERWAQAATIKPVTEAGQEAFKSVGEALEPVGHVATALAPMAASGLGVATRNVLNYTKMTPKQAALRTALEQSPRDPALAKYLIIDGKPKASAALQAAAKQFGGEQGNAVVAIIKNASKRDQSAIRKMVEIVQKGKKDPLFADANRVGDVVGESLKNRVMQLKRLNDQAGKAIDDVARNQLAGKKVDMLPVRNQFKAAMDDLRVSYDPVTGAVDFTGSALEGSGAGASRDLITRLARRMKKPNMDAADAHFVKKMIDKDVVFGKSPSGAAGVIDDSVKGLRKGINEAIRDVSEPYKKANIKYSETVQALENLQKAAGSTINLEDPIALAKSARSLTNNTNSRAKLISSFSEIDDTLGKYGITFKDDIATQNYIANMLENRFKLAGTTSIEGIGTRIAEEATKSNVQRAIDISGKVIDKATGVSDEKALSSLLNILEID